MAHYQVVLAYDGMQFFGFQRQGRTRTVQSEVEGALNTLGWQGSRILAAGRTDTGVHATGQVIAFDLEWAHSPDELGRALNARLPEDVAVREVREVTPEFHPRYDARSRSYQYRLYCEPQRSPLIERFAWRVWPSIELDRLQAAARLFLGKHDFSAFGTPPRPGGTTVRTVLRSDWKLHNGSFLYEVRADAFLYHMVRRMVFLQVRVGKGHLLLENLEMAIQYSREESPGLAPAKGLVLTEVWY